MRDLFSLIGTAVFHIREPVSEKQNVKHVIAPEKRSEKILQSDQMNVKETHQNTIDVQKNS